MMHVNLIRKGFVSFAIASSWIVGVEHGAIAIRADLSDFPSGLILGHDGRLYGVTGWDGDSRMGSVFKVTKSGRFKTLYSFKGGKDGEFPRADPVFGSDGCLYGTTIWGGKKNFSPSEQDNGGELGMGTIFKVTPSGRHTVLHTFNGNDGFCPTVLIRGPGSSFYGITDNGGKYGFGCIYSITTSGVLTTLHSFSDKDQAGFDPNSLALGKDGDLYGSTVQGGTKKVLGSRHDYEAPTNGTIFRLTRAGVLITLYSFQGDIDGGYANGVIQGSNGCMYGTTSYGGKYNYGAVFKLTSAGEFVTLKSFNYPGGYYPISGITQDRSGNLFGSTELGGPGGSGTLFKISMTGKFNYLYAFSGLHGEGYRPNDNFVETTDGSFYGTTHEGFEMDGGTIFRLTRSGRMSTLYTFRHRKSDDM